MFKVGDKVKRISSGHPVESPIGVVRTVTVASNSEGWFGATEECSEGSRGCFERYWELVKPGLTESQSSGIAGGLQEHSVGEYYPLAAVMYEHGGESIITIENLQTGEVNSINGRPVNWDSFEEAYKRMESKPTTNWAKGRVSYSGDRWVVAEPANPVRVTRLRNMLHRG